MLQGKVAIVTGAGRGLGRAIAQRLAKEGASVALLSRSAGPLEEAVALVRDAGGTAIGIPCDMTDRAAIPASVKQVIDAFGTVDILINNAHDTAVNSMSAPFAEASVEQLMHQFECGPLGAVLMMQACLPYLKQSGGGRIINVASSVGVKGMVNFLPYAMAKEALRAATRVAAREWAEFGITVNSVCPAADTEGAQDAIASGVLGTGGALPPIARLGSSEHDIAPLVSFLVSEGASYLTGYTYMADGGGSIDTAR